MGPSLLNQPSVCVADLPDAELLRRYSTGRDSPALEALVQRHGGMVFGVCRRILVDPHDAEDAFQATFLVFVRKAASIRPGAMVGPWLYGVATRTALKARALAARRRAREKQVDALPNVAAPAMPVAADWLPLLDREVAGLPAKYRLPVLLCDLHGLSRADAARELDVRQGTLSSRLARARAILRRRLSKRGAGAAVLVAVALFPSTATAAAPAALVETTVEAATAFAAGVALTTPPALLATAILTSLRRARLAFVATLVASLAVVGGAGLLLSRTGQPAPVVDLRTDHDKLQGSWAVVTMKYNGGDAGLPEEPVFRDDRVNLPFDSEFKLDTTADPKQIDLTCHLIGPPNNFMLGIYEVNGDDLKLCLGPPGSRDRPTAFAAEPGSWQSLIILKRRLPAQ